MKLPRRWKKEEHQNVTPIINGEAVSPTGAVGRGRRGARPPVKAGEEGGPRRTTRRPQLPCGMHAGDVAVASTLDNRHQPALNGRISVKNSAGVHVGHRIYYNAPVNVILPDNSVTLRPEQLNKVEQSFTDHTVPADKKRNCRLNKKRAIILAVAVTVVIVVVVVIAVVLTRPTPLTPDDNQRPFKIITRQQWHAVNQTKDIPLLKVRPAPYVIIAHTAENNCNNEEQCKTIVKNIQSYHISLGYGDIGYNFLIGGDGAAYEGEGWEKYGRPSIPFNSRSIMIGFIGYFVTKPPPFHQIKTCQLLLEEGLKLKKITPDYKLFVHKQISNTESPGSAFIEEIITWAHWSKDVPKIVRPAVKN